jgi:enoyl-CoA hydratase/carnithine racemase
MTGACEIRMSSEIRVEEKEGYALIVIDREAKRNAMNRSARQGLRAALDHVRGRFPVMVLTGSGGSFCAGIDLKERVEDRDKGADTASAEWVEVNLEIRRHPAIVIAAVNGIALGGGTTLINVSDLAIAAENAQIGMPELGFATYPGMAGPSTQLTINRKRAAWMMLTTNRIDGRTAEAWGLVNRCVAAGDLLTAADELARQVAQFDPVALAATKRALDVIPAAISNWEQALTYGNYANFYIRGNTEAQSRGLDRFHSGKKNPGQG